MKLLAMILVIGGFCVGTLGAAGFDRGEIRENAYAYFAGGLLLLIVGGILTRMSRRTADAGSFAGAAPSILEGMDNIRTIVAELDNDKRGIDSETLRQRVDHLLRNEFFDLTSRHEELIASLGFSNYAKVWEGVASAERLLNRYWSMATDGHHEEALEEIPLARAHMERASETMAEISAATA